jgi:hypothetical protein
VGFTLLLAPHLGDSLRSAGGQILVIALPVLAVSIGLLGAAWARTQRIDAMVAHYLRTTVGDKLEAYLVGSSAEDGFNPYPPLFVRMDRLYRSDISSFCFFRCLDADGRTFDFLVKSNVFNIEIAIGLDLTAPPAGFKAEFRERSYDATCLEDWPSVVANPLVELVAATIHGSLAEGYTVFVEADDCLGDGLRVTYRLRQKLESNFLTSPYLRRYFSEDAAIASYYFFTEALADGGKNVRGGAVLTSPSTGARAPTSG